MENNDTAVSKFELKQILLIEKLEGVVESLQIRLKESEEVNTDLLEKNASMVLKNDELKKEVNETLQECQLHVNDIEAQNDILLSKILSEEEMSFYFGCKVDLIGNKMTDIAKDFSKDFLTEKIPTFVLDMLTDKSPSIFTSNFTLTKVNDSSYKLSKNV